jgi:hypothetical protein
MFITNQRGLQNQIIVHATITSYYMHIVFEALKQKQNLKTNI